MAYKFSVISPAATFELTPSVNVVDEGAYITITLSTTGVQLGQSIPYEIYGTGITVSDFDNISALTGEFVINYGTSTILLHTAADQLLEGLETFYVRLVDYPLVSTRVDITDTSYTLPVASWWNLTPITSNTPLAATSTILVTERDVPASVDWWNTSSTTTSNTPLAATSTILVTERDVPASVDWWNTSSTTVGAVSFPSNVTTYQEV